jgi:HlyD family secretion protein
MMKFFSMVLAVAAAIAYVALDRASLGTEITYTTIPVEMGRLKEEITATGTVDALIKVDVSSQVSGRITDVSVDFNNSVVKGQPLARIDRQGFDARVAEAMAAVNIALAAVEVQNATLERAGVEIEAVKLERDVYRARIDQAEAGLSVVQSKLKRKEMLRESGTISVANIEDDRGAVLTAEAFLREAEALFAANEHRIGAARAEFARAQAELVGARANVPQRQAALQLAEVELARTTIRAPIDGVIIDRSIDEGQTVAAALEAPTLFTILRVLRKPNLMA